MPASTPELLSGTFSITVELSPDADPDAHAQLRALLEVFLRGIDLGFFDDSSARPASRVLDDCVWENDGRRLLVRFAAHDVPRRSFTILAGMLVGHTLHLGVPVTSASARLQGFPFDLLASPSLPLSGLPTLPFASEIPSDGPTHKSLRIWVDFVRPIPQDQGDVWKEAFAVWDSLVLGPFPAEGRPIGDSWAGPALTSFLLPTRIEHAIEDYESGPAAFDILNRALLRFHQRWPIDSLEIE